MCTHQYTVNVCDDSQVHSTRDRSGRLLCTICFVLIILYSNLNTIAMNTNKALVILCIGSFVVGFIAGALCVTEYIKCMIS